MLCDFLDIITYIFFLYIYHVTRSNLVYSGKNFVIGTLRLKYLFCKYHAYLDNGEEQCFILQQCHLAAEGDAKRCHFMTFHDVIRRFLDVRR